MRITLDSGARIAVEANDRSLWAALKLAALDREDVLVPSTALAQVWRGGPWQARLGGELTHCVIVGFDGLAREVGVLCGATATADICDAHLAIVASDAGGLLITSDPADLRKLIAARPPRKALSIIRC